MRGEAGKTGAVAMALVCAFAAGNAAAQTYPNKPVRILVPLAAGGGMDTVARGLAQKLSDAFGQNFVVDNRPGAGNQIALDIVAASAPDGHTLMVISATTVVHPILYQSRFDIVRDFMPVSQITAQGYVLAVHPTIAAKSVAEFVQELRANPGKFNYASSGIGSAIHMSGELFKIATGTRMTHIPFKGMGAAYSDLIGGHVQVSFPTIISSIPHVKAGRLRALAVTTPKRAPALPDIPIFAEAGVQGIVVLQSSDVIKRLVAEGSEAVGGTPQQFAAHIRAERELWTKVIKQAGIRGE